MVPMQLQLVHGESCESGRKSKGELVLGSWLENGPSPLKLKVLKRWLDGYHNKIDVEYLRVGLRD